MKTTIQDFCGVPSAAPLTDQLGYAFGLTHDSVLRGLKALHDEIAADPAGCGLQSVRIAEDATPRDFATTRVELVFAVPIRGRGAAAATPDDPVPTRSP